MSLAGIPQIELGAKEGVALINGTAISTAIGILALHDAQELLETTQVAVAMTAEAMRGYRDAFLPYVHRLRSGYQETIAERLLALVDGSTLMRGAANVDLGVIDGPPQDPYGIRCAPAVLGAALRAMDHVEVVLSDELAAVTDNPLIFASEIDSDENYLPRQTKMISGGNFHGEPIALAMDYLSIATAEIANIAERRIFTLTDPKLNRGLPPFLIDDATGLNSGLMIAQYTAASLVSENKSLAHPASVDSIPSSANKEDHVSMSTIAARKAAQIVKNAQVVVALELLCAAQAISLRVEQNPTLNIGRGTAKALDLIRSCEIAPNRKLDVIRQDVPIAPYVNALLALIQSGDLSNLV
jgi:histidine ammonia-lyase